MLKYRVEMYVPMNTPEQEKEFERVFKVFCKVFGGATVNPVVSGWVDSKGILIKDKIGIIHSFGASLTLKMKKSLQDLAITVRDNLNEDCILLVINEEAEFY